MHMYRSEEVRHASQIADSACPFCTRVNAKKGTLSQHFVMHIVPPLGAGTDCYGETGSWMKVHLKISGHLHCTRSVWPSWHSCG